MNVINFNEFNCTQCGDCCRWSGSVLLTDDDITQMALFLNVTEEEFIRTHTELAPNRKQLALIDNPDGSCRFLQGNGCELYAVRPEQCKTFPYKWSVAEGCPALDKLRSEQKRVDQADENP